MKLSGNHTHRGMEENKTSRVRETSGGNSNWMNSALERERQSCEWQKDNGQFVPDARKWLRNKRWEDEVEAPHESPTAPLERDADGLTPRDKFKAQLERKQGHGRKQVG